MSLNLKSKSPKANAHLTMGVDRLLRFQQQPEDPAILSEAEEDLNKALEEDPAFLPAVYYRGLTRELKGENDLAISDLSQVVESRPPFKAEAQFNLGVARFHKYHRPDLEQAEAEFQAVLQTASISEQLRLQTMASLAQVHGQLMIQRDPENPNYDEIEQHFFRIVRTETEICALTRDKPLGPPVMWRIENALGLGYMFASDYFSDIELKDRGISRREMLLEARRYFEIADLANRDNWAILCNLGSIWMRISYWKILEEPEVSFERSESFLKRVVDRIRPNYGFALYELGRLNRVNAKFEDALTWFKRSEDVPEEKRDVGRKTLDREIKRGQERSSVFP
jgi:tetratricopeptide (TPR) repeat protein